MVQSPTGTCPPQGLPVLSHGKHRNPTRGACFMEYTSILAGERFTDSPACVDVELAAVLRGANDRLSDDERTAMVPLLGRAIGLVVPAPEFAAGRVGIWRRRRAVGESDSVARTEALRRTVADRFLREVGVGPSHPRWNWYHGHLRLSRLFWELLDEPAPPETPAEHAERLVARLELLHRCYEMGLAEIGVPREAVPAASAPEPAGGPAARAAAGHG